MALFENVKVGDTVTRNLAGGLIELVVGEIKDGIIYCGTKDDDPSPFKVGRTKEDGAWGFRVENGAEVDEDLGWDGIKLTGSFLTKV